MCGCVDLGVDVSAFGGVGTKTFIRCLRGSVRSRHEAERFGLRSVREGRWRVYCGRDELGKLGRKEKSEKIFRSLGERKCGVNAARECVDGGLGWVRTWE